MDMNFQKKVQSFKSVIENIRSFTLSGANNRSPIIIHPGPVNRGVEISLEVMESTHSLILDQVTNGVAIRMALMYQLLGGAENDIN